MAEKGKAVYRIVINGSQDAIFRELTSTDRPLGAIFNSTGSLTLTPTGNATRVSWTNEGDVGKNPLMRWFVPFMDSMMGPDFEGGLANLKALAEKP